MDEGLKVTYNGGVDSFYPCTKPTDLVVGQTYTVVSSVKRTTNLQKDYILEGISGQFCSEWFFVWVIPAERFLWQWPTPRLSGLPAL